jgi:hypothetical protein
MLGRRVLPGRTVAAPGTPRRFHHGLLVVALLLGSLPAAGQAPAAHPPPGRTPSPAAKKWTPPRTPWNVRGAIPISFIDRGAECFMEVANLSAGDDIWRLTAVDHFTVTPAGQISRLVIDHQRGAPATGGPGAAADTEVTCGILAGSV